MSTSISETITRRKQQIEEMENQNQDLMKEAMERALSGGRPKNSINKFIRKVNRPDLADSPEKKNR